MKVKFLLLFLFYSLFSVSECWSQVFEDRLHKKGGFRTYKVDLKKNAKSVSCRTYYDVGHRLKFDKDIFQYNRDSKFEYLGIHYDKDGAVTSYETKSDSRNYRGELIDIHEEYQRDYNSDGHLIKRTTFSSDTLTSVVDLDYKYDDEKRIIEIKKTTSTNNRINSSLEEIEYFENGMKSTIYSVKDSVKTYINEYVFDLNEKLLTETQQQKSLNRGRRQHTDYFYSDKGMLDTKIWFWYNPSMSIVEGFVNGGYIKYIYDDKDVLMTVIDYDLEVENVDGETNYLKGQYRSKSKYKEKKIGSNILQIVKSRRGNGPYRITRRVILDHHRNKILEYKTSDRRCTLEIREIVYY